VLKRYAPAGKPGPVHSIDLLVPPTNNATRALNQICAQAIVAAITNHKRGRFRTNLHLAAAAETFQTIGRGLCLEFLSRGSFGGSSGTL